MDKDTKQQLLSELKDPSLRMGRILNEKLIGDAIAKINLSKGEKGEKGDKGDIGLSIKGEKGDSGIDGKDGKDGKNGLNGEDGKDGKDGTNGKDGMNGKDADSSLVVDTVIGTLKTRKIQDIANLDDLVGFLKRGGFRGGGGSGSGSSGVSSFNTRTGAVTLSSLDVTTALGYTPSKTITLTTTGSSGASTFNSSTGALNIPQYSGGSGTPGGSSNDVQYNSSGSFAGDSNFTWDTSTLIVSNGGTNANVANFLTPGDGYVGFSNGRIQSASGDFQIFSKLGSNVNIGVNGNSNLYLDAIGNVDFGNNINMGNSVFIQFNGVSMFGNDGANSIIRPASGSNSVIIQNNTGLSNLVTVGDSGSVTLSSLGNGLVKSTSGLLSNATAGTDYLTVLTGAITSSGNATSLGSFTSAQLAGALTDETGTGANVFGTTPTIATPVINGISTGTGVSTSSTVSTLILRDTQGSAFAINFVDGFNSAATAGGTTTLTNVSNPIRVLTGTLAQTLVLPVTSTLVVGYQYQITNQSVGAVTVQSSGANTILVLASGTSATFTCVLASGTGVASWNAQYFGALLSNGKSLSVSNTLSLAGTDGTTITFQGTDTYVGRATTDTLTNKTFDTAGTGNSLKINGTAITAVNGTGAVTLTTSPTFVTPTLGVATASSVIYTNNAITATSNAATVPVTSRLSTVTNSSAATLTITITTTSAVDGQLLMVRILDFSAVAQILAWVNTENSTVTAPIVTNGSTTLFLTVGFIYNSATSKWRCIASA